MARIRKGIIGSLSGNVGNLSGFSKYGKSHIRKTKSELKDKSKVSDQKQNIRFSNVNDYYKIYGSQLEYACDLLGFKETDLKQRIIQGQKVFELENVGNAWNKGVISCDKSFVSPMGSIAYQTNSKRLLIRWHRLVDKVIYPSDGQLRGYIVRDVGSSPIYLYRNLPTAAPRLYSSAYSTDGSGRVTLVARLYSYELGFVGPIYFVSVMF